MKSKIGYKLIVALVGTIVPAIILFFWLIIQAQHEQMIGHVKQQTYQLSEMVKNSTKYDMLTKQRDRVHRVIETIGQQEGIRNIRIYNKEGAIIFSTEKKETGTSVDQRAEACYGCHAADRPLQKLETSERARIFRTKDGTRYLGTINPIYNEPSCWTAPCHAHSPEQSVLGVLDFTLSLEDIDRQLRRDRLKLIFFTVVVLIIVGGLLWLLVQQFVARPVGELVQATNVIADGDLAHRVKVDSRDELGNLARSFNTMTEKLAQVQRQVYQQDKLASLGRLAAGLAHEINNPLTGILSNSSLALKRSEPGSQAHDELNVIVRESKRCREIVRRLLDFARQAPSQKVQTDINTAVEQSLKILENQLEVSHTAVDVKLAGDLPPVYADGTQVQQVVINLIVNAIDAMENRPNKALKIRTSPAEHEGRQFIDITVSDTGSGISKSDAHKIFEPFYTTKGVKGTGLGLSVVWGIIQDHQGLVEFQSEQGEGTTFVVSLPVSLRRIGPRKARFI